MTEREGERVAGEIIKSAPLKSKTGQIREIWPAVEALKRSYRSYQEIHQHLLPRYGVTMTYRQFLGACWMIRHGRKKGAGSVSRVKSRRPDDAVTGNRQGHDPFAAVREKEAASMRPGEILAGRF
jgi:hypothetical protein